MTCSKAAYKMGRNLASSMPELPQAEGEPKIASLLCLYYFNTVSYKS